MSNKVLITNDQNVVKIPSGLRILIRRSCNAVLDFEKFDGPAEISVTFVDNNRIHELNNEYRHKDSATDVLSFPLGENGSSVPLLLRRGCRSMRRQSRAQSALNQISSLV